MSVWEQRQYADPLVGRPGSQGRERQPPVAARSVWEAMYVHIIMELIDYSEILMSVSASPQCRSLMNELVPLPATTAQLQALICNVYRMDT